MNLLHWGAAGTREGKKIIYNPSEPRNFLFQYLHVFGGFLTILSGGLDRRKAGIEKGEIQVQRFERVSDLVSHGSCQRSK